MMKCKKCGFKTWNKRRYKKHTCEEVTVVGQAVERDTSRQEIKAEQIEVKENFNPYEEESLDVDYDDMTIQELRNLAKEEGLTGIYGKSKAELIEALKEGE